VEINSVTVKCQNMDGEVRVNHEIRPSGEERILIITPIEPLVAINALSAEVLKAEETDKDGPVSR
jgi:hypothetical protein